MAGPIPCNGSAHTPSVLLFSAVQCCGAGVWVPWCGDIFTNPGLSVPWSLCCACYPSIMQLGCRLSAWWLCWPPWLRLPDSTCMPYGPRLRGCLPCDSDAGMLVRRYMQVRRYNPGVDAPLEASAAAAQPLLLQVCSHLAQGRGTLP